MLAFTRFYARLLCPVLLLSYCTAYAEKHPHQGVLEPYLEKPESIQLSEKEKQKLARFKPVYKKMITQQGEHGLAVFRVAASKQVIWSVLHDFQFYADWVDDLSDTEVYKREKNDIYVRFDSSHWLLGNSTWYVKHSYPAPDLTEQEYAEQNWGSWTLDYQHRSDFNDSVGFWQILPVPGQPYHHDVVYSIALSLNNTPAFIKNHVIKNGLKTATQWVKQQAEKREYAE